jgi:hypothetical protein
MVSMAEVVAAFQGRQALAEGVAEGSTVLRKEVKTSGSSFGYCSGDHDFSTISQN